MQGQSNPFLSHLPRSPIHRLKPNPAQPALPRPSLIDTEEVVPDLPTLPNLAKALAQLPPPFGERRTDSFKRLMSDPNLRRRFFEEFLVNVFNAMPPDTLNRLIARGK